MLDGEVVSKSFSGVVKVPRFGGMMTKRDSIRGGLG